MSDINEIFDKAREGDKVLKASAHARMQCTESAELSTHTVEVNVFGPGGTFVEADKVTVKYEIQVGWASWGISGIEVWPRGQVEVYMSHDDDDSRKEFSVIVDFDKTNVEVEYMSGQGYVAESLDVHLTKDFKLERAVFNCFSIDK